MSNHLVMRNISKHFGGVQALRNVSLEAHGGQVHALMGENGAGKSTLMKILAGAYTPDEGEISLDGQRLTIDSPHAAQAHGISVIHQEFSLAKHLSVAENIFLHDLGAGRTIINWSKLKARAREQLDALGFGELDVSRPVATLSVAEQQIVEICKALSRTSRVLVFDEPTAVLTARETTRLFALLERLKRDGVCIIYISHRLEEIFHLCDSATVLKDGAFVSTVRIADIDEHRLVQLMVGRELGDLFPARDARIGETRLDIRDLCAGERVRDVSFHARAGEVLGFSGLVGAGRTETMRAIFGADRRDSGEIRVDGRLIAHLKRPRHGIESGIGMLPEDRKQQGVLLNMPIRVNAMMKPRNTLARLRCVLDHRAERAQTRELIKRLRVKARDTEIDVSTLSGGNQQKVALMKWLSNGCRVLILDEPTRGVDIGAKIEIYQVINDLARAGVAVIVVSSDMPEIIGLCDRVLVMRAGRIAGELSGPAINEKSLISLAMGVK
ncbi:sugar ABC transporter ATP-binding protein [Paraburkholderia unamae]|uniref:Monosaccharide ABC transporter ATP-binding protein (CUT2 family) n=1 Tax=Paraburkholderia unamae TaxID=219649 RepID=A0ABX5KJ18_9BURK|nr:sugar ABC transporter ATP-binding protein [Paraburkholderia unamae]PVX81314.1 monosaccharide ABC transporter ATP-binding protein (CUT2 family) [Paraburkholderia unamae]RAR57221.1 monosaccharide ABC transporter ATP-binding protein (CUT2 family) [Paraburkholderia unamae]